MLGTTVYTRKKYGFRIEMAQAEITMVPQTSATITAEADLKAWNKMMDLLEDDDDVQEVYHNFEDSER